MSTSHFHPMMVHFPIAIVTIGFIADLASLFFKKETWLQKSALWLLIFGTLAALAAVITGALFTSEMSGSAGEVRETHEMFAFITLGALVVTSVFKIIVHNKPTVTLKWVAFLLYAIATLSVSITGFFGGTLVYNYMMPL